MPTRPRPASLRGPTEMADERLRELWRHRESGELYLVELQDERVVSAHGPLGEDEAGAESLAWRTASHGRSAAFSPEATRLEERRDEYERVARPGGGGRDS